MAKLDTQILLFLALCEAWQVVSNAHNTRLQERRLLQPLGSTKGLPAFTADPPATGVVDSSNPERCWVVWR